MEKPTHVDREGKARSEGGFGWAEITRPAWRRPSRAGIALQVVAWVVSIAATLPTNGWLDAGFPLRRGESGRWVVVLVGWWVLTYGIGYAWLRKRGVSITERRRAGDPWKPPLRGHGH